jgi:hypothetical protein
VQIGLEASERAFIRITKGEQRCGLTVHLIGRLRKLLDAERDRLARQLAAMEEDSPSSSVLKKQERIKQRIVTLSMLISSQWKDLMDDLKLPPPGKAIVPTPNKPKEQRYEWPDWAVKLSQGKAADEPCNKDDTMIFINLSLQDS